MSVVADDFATATRYLRGELDDTEREAFEERLLEDDALEELTAAAETELVDLHVRDQLQGEARSLFDRRMAQEPALRARRELSRLLFTAARSKRPAIAERAPRARSRRLWLAAPALLAAAAIAFFLWPRDPATRADELVSVVVQAPTRSSTVPKILLAQASARLRLTLEAPADAVISVVGPAGPVAVVPVAATANAVTVELDARALVDGLYELTARPATGAPLVFQVRIVR